MNNNELATTFSVAYKDKEDGLAVLRKVLRDNDYKETQIGAETMLDSISDLLDPAALIYWKTLAINLN